MYSSSKIAYIYKGHENEVTFRNEYTIKEANDDYKMGCIASLNDFSREYYTSVTDNYFFHPDEVTPYYFVNEHLNTYGIIIYLKEKKHTVIISEEEIINARLRRPDVEIIFLDGGMKDKKNSYGKDKGAALDKIIEIKEIMIRVNDKKNLTFINKLQDFYVEKGYLSPKQFFYVIEAADNNHINIKKDLFNIHLNWYYEESPLKNLNSEKLNAIVPYLKPDDQKLVLKMLN